MEKVGARTSEQKSCKRGKTKQKLLLSAYINSHTSYRLYTNIWMDMDMDLCQTEMYGFE